MPNGQELIKVLSIDGGGIRGVIPSMVLAEIENKTGKRTAEMFDLMAGTSAGGIITLGLNVRGQNGKPKFSAEQISEIFRNDGPKIFEKKFLKKYGLIDERYDHRPLVDVLRRYMNRRELYKSYTRTLVCSYDIYNRETVFFKSWRDEYNKFRMWEICRATSAAPTYFEPIQLDFAEKQRVLVDGGVFINNPAMSAYTEATRLRNDGVLANKPIILLSIGTGELNAKIPYEKAKNWGILQWVVPILDVVFDGVSDAVDYQLMRVFELTDKDKNKNEYLYSRLQIGLDEDKDDFDDASEENITALENKAKKLVHDNQQEIDKICEIIG